MKKNLSVLILGVAVLRLGSLTTDGRRLVFIGNRTGYPNLFDRDLVTMEILGI